MNNGLKFMTHTHTHTHTLHLPLSHSLYLSPYPSLLHPTIFYSITNSRNNKISFLFSAESRQAYGSHGSSASSSASSSNQHSSSSHNQRGGHSDNSNGNNKTNGPHPSYPIGRMRHSSSISSSSEFTSVSQQPVRQNNFSDRENDRVSIRSGRVGNLGVAANLAQSRESFQQALDNPCEYFIDVM